jgi:hypothetical protein
MGVVRRGSARDAARSATVRIKKFASVSLLAASSMCAPFIARGQQETTTAAPPEMQHEHHGGFMQGGTHHAVAKGVTLEAKVDAAAHTLTLRVGPMTLPANTGHMKMPQPPDLVWDVPMDGWLIAYHPQLVDGEGNAVPGTVLHHTAFWNENRADFLCPNKEEHIFGAGSEMTDWAEVPGYGYRVEKGDKIRIETMVYNPTATPYDKIYLQVQIPYADANRGSVAKMIQNVYPAWMDVKSCGDSSYDLPPGKSEKSGTVTVKYEGVLLGVGGHLHDYGRQVVLQDVSRKETVATLDAKVGDQGQVLSMPTKLFLAEGGYKFGAGDVLKISATYENPTGKLLHDGAMGIAVGYFVPAHDTKMAALRRKTNPSHNMPEMSHDH